MTKKEKILSSFIINIIEDEKPSSLHILSEKDLSQLLKRIETTKIKSLNISPQIDKKSDENFDLYIILDDIKFSEADIGTVKNLLSQKIVVFTDLKNDKNTDEIMLKLGFNKELRDKTNKLKCFSYNLKTYNNKRTWNNPTGWANPENFDKFRW
jgi:Holliday junction resolvasome RuvABC DNA-binding subunit